MSIAGNPMGGERMALARSCAAPPVGITARDGTVESAFATGLRTQQKASSKREKIHLHAVESGWVIVIAVAIPPVGSMMILLTV
tara:strand:+ start:103930 stop:104181 length:252 start_codon:yes stop_codon:yes gene_type:complete